MTGPCTAVQYGIIMLTYGSQEMKFRHDGKPIQWNTELSGWPQTWKNLEYSGNSLNLEKIT